MTTIFAVSMLITLLIAWGCALWLANVGLSKRLTRAENSLRNHQKQEGRMMAQETELRQRIADAKLDIDFCKALWEMQCFDAEIGEIFDQAERRLRMARRELQDVRCEGN